MSNQNPASEINTLITEFDRILSNGGAITASDILLRVDKVDVKSGPSEIDNISRAISIGKTILYYPQLEEITAEVIARTYEEAYFAQLKLPEIPEVGHDSSENIRRFIKYIAKVKFIIRPLIDDEVGSIKKNNFFSTIENKKKILNKGFFYEFSDGDLDRVQSLINELREQISGSDLFEENHRSRLLRRLESLQSEIHKKMSDVDKIWGLVGDAGVVIGKFGKDAKPFVDRIKELSQIAWKTQARAEELPSSSQNPLLGNEER
ncbi:hypothetical protein [Shewanella decolorationis]|uniref:Uncharacterized protein n=2 Tax=Shewanella decolorationis TaxID=256839 RepID=A0A5B8QR54_9GAMM|nr:hypothetical protein [Shewanella decolorationis]ESE42238.1 hypothetical protein SHD_1153 [Shewanella decolorationis S12]QDZ89130.1 hypothetical protein D0436_00915 [Shewanella decolorationis]GLR31965.1 hypothetical protein GCM10007922_15220 [Shewanella decolorationis]